MSQWAGGVLTAAGRTLQAKVEAGTTTLVLTKIKLGDGTESMDAVDNLTDLVGPKAVLGISSSVADGDHATITGVMLSTQLQAGFWCREWGLFARDPDAGEILYMVTIDAQPEWLPASTAAAQVSATYAMNIAVANATNIEVQIDPAGLVDVEMLQSYIGLSKRSTAYAVGDTTLLENIPAGFFVECTKAGTTGSTAPVISSPTVGDTVTDGTVVWTIRKSASTQDLTNYLPLAGGTMTGATIKRNIDNAYINLRGGNDSGASLVLYGKNFDNGSCHLLASNDSERSHLYLTASGNLRFIPDDVNNPSVQHDLAGSAIRSKSIGTALGYKITADGLHIEYGRQAITAGVATDITFCVSYNGGYVASVTPSSGTASVGHTDLTKMTISTSNTVYVDWIAIGQ